MLKRRQFLLTSGAVIATSGCTGSQDETDAEPSSATTETSETETETSTTTQPTPTPNDGVVGEPVESGPASITFEQIAVGESIVNTYTDPPSEKAALDGSQYIAYDVTIEATGDTPFEVDRGTVGDFQASYLGHDTPGHDGEGFRIRNSDREISGESLTSWKEDFGNSPTMELFPGDSVTGSIVVTTPTKGYQAADLLLTYNDGNISATVRGDTNTPRPPYEPPTPEPGNYSIGDQINDRGVSYTISDYRLTDSLTADTYDYEPESENAQFIILTLELENVSPVSRSIISRPKLLYAGQEAEPGGFATAKIEVEGDSFPALYAPYTNRDNEGKRTDGRKFYPDVSLAGSVVYVVPEKFDESNVEVIMREQTKIKFTI